MLYLLAHLLIASASATETVAVSYFDTNTVEAKLKPLGRGIADMLTTDLSQSKDITVVERQRLNDILSELQLQRTDVIDPKTAAQMGKALGADAVLVGALTVLDDRMRIDARMVDVQTGAVRFAVDEEGPTDKFFRLEGRLAASILDNLQAEISDKQSASLANPDASSIDAAVSYSQAIDAYDAGDHDTANEAARRATKEDSKLRLARALAINTMPSNMLGASIGFDSTPRPKERPMGGAATVHYWPTRRVGVYGQIATPWISDYSDDSWVLLPIATGARLRLFENMGSQMTVVGLNAGVVADPVLYSHADGTRSLIWTPGVQLGGDFELFGVNSGSAGFFVRYRVDIQPHNWHPNNDGPFATPPVGIGASFGYIFYFLSKQRD